MVSFNACRLTCSCLVKSLHKSYMLKAAASVKCCFRRTPHDLAADEPKDSCCSCCCRLSTLDAADIEHCRQQGPSKCLQEATFNRPPSSLLGLNAKMRRATDI